MEAKYVPLWKWGKSKIQQRSVESNFIEGDDDEIGSKKYLCDYRCTRNECPCFIFYFILKWITHKIWITQEIESF